MNDTVRQFEAGDIDPEHFNHEAHVRVAWLILQESTLLEAISRYRKALRKVTAKLGIPGKYHETITWFFMIKIAERQAEQDAVCWETFRDANPDLAGNAGPLMSRYYSCELLQSDEARRNFMLPDRVAA